MMLQIYIILCERLHCFTSIKFNKTSQILRGGGKLNPREGKSTPSPSPEINPGNASYLEGEQVIVLQVSGDVLLELPVQILSSLKQVLRSMPALPDEQQLSIKNTACTTLLLTMDNQATTLSENSRKSK